MAEGLVTALIRQMVSIAAQEAEQEIRLVVGVDEEVEKLKSHLQTVKAVLNDAEKRQVLEEAVKLWLEKLNNACYEIEDIVDECNTAIIKSAIQKEGNADNATFLKKVQSFIPSPSCCLCQVDKLVKRHDIAHKIKQMSGKLDEIVRERGMYGFELTRGSTLEVLQRPKTTNFVDASGICGHDEVRNNLCKVANEIIESIECQSSNMTALQSLLDRICDIVGGNKFFLILDDVWTEELIIAFILAFKCCAQGSRILVTTRKGRVAKMIGGAHIMNLSQLSNVNCWLIFTFLDKDPEQCEQLEDLGRQIAKRCKGLPLAAKTLGSLMHFKKDVERGLFALLLLSYYDLLSPFKRCFLYCAIFPKDYVFSSDDLIFVWMAQEYIKSKANLEMEHFRYLRALTLNCGNTLLNEPLDAVGNFIHLRYLNLVKYSRDRLPETICNLCNLQSLKITINSDMFKELPKGMGKLINLKHFILDSKFGLNGAQKMHEAENAQLKKTIDLLTLVLRFNRWNDEDRGKRNDALILNALEPPPDLEYLHIDDYLAIAMFPDWMISLTKLKKIYIRSELLKFLPSLGKLPFLESSHIEDLKDLEKVGVEFLGIESKKKKDNKIIIKIGEEEEEEDNYITIMPRLQYLNIIFCPKSLPDFLRTTPLKDLVIYRNRILQECCKWGTGED
ncbi:hypothetical protein RGQ29_024038 [Quercus rubra]|uniref:Uncharacterized protein n=1 Tax=Quercus rubra TaxID=3512 RepID=A0AAN7IUY1_QUERU|nr:hypothetical protein RGQ29_024038 [Quercus rubra]